MKIFAAIALFAAAFLLWFRSAIVEPYLMLDFDRVQLFHPMWDARGDGMKIAVLTDIHYGDGFLEDIRARRAVSKANAAGADLIVILGDYITTPNPFNRVMAKRLARELKKLKAPLGVYAILGNHDSYYGRDRIKRALLDCQIPVLENSSAVVDAGEKGSFALAGIADPITQNYYFRPTFENIPESMPAILLSHSPDAFREAPPNARITLSGHTHGGQIRLPLYGALITNTHVEKIAEGKRVRRGSTLYVSRGLGASRVPARFLCPPAVTVVEIRRGAAK